MINILFIIVSLSSTPHSIDRAIYIFTKVIQKKQKCNGVTTAGLLFFEKHANKHSQGGHNDKSIYTKSQNMTQCHTFSFHLTENSATKAECDKSNHSKTLWHALCLISNGSGCEKVARKHE